MIQQYVIDHKLSFCHHQQIKLYFEVCYFIYQVHLCIVVTGKCLTCNLEIWWSTFHRRRLFCYFGVFMFQELHTFRTYRLLHSNSTFCACLLYTATLLFGLQAGPGMHVVLYVTAAVTAGISPTPRIPFRCWSTARRAPPMLKDEITYSSNLINKIKNLKKKGVFEILNSEKFLKFCSF